MFFAGLHKPGLEGKTPCLSMVVCQSLLVNKSPKSRRSIYLQRIVIWDCVLSPWSEVLQNSSACAWQCMNFWQLCLHWSWHCQRRKFRNTCFRRNINLKCSKTWIVSCHSASAISTRERRGCFVITLYSVWIECRCLFQTTRLTDLQWQRSIFHRRKCWIPTQGASHDSQTDP